jgi:4-hydroxy-tetrahydrodipicolinate synthase
MKTPIFTGSCTAIVTPYHNGTIDYDKMGEYIDFQYEGGTSALVVCGTTGEAATQTIDEHAQLIDFCVKKNAGRMKIIAGVGSNDTNTAFELSVAAKSCGADATLMVTPYYNKTSQRGLVQHFSYVADRVDIPMVLYNVPSRTSIGIAAETYAELAKHPNINGVKEASGDFSLISRTIKLCGDDLNIWSGNDDNTLALMAMGGKGVISVFTNILPKPMAEMCKLCLDGDFAAAREIHNRYSNLFHDLFLETNPIPVKTAMNLMGMDAGELRLPLWEMAPANVEKLKATLIECGVELK